METPSSTRRVTRSQTLASANKNNNNIPISKKIEEFDKNLTTKSGKKSGEKKQDRSALIDISNNSPIVGLAMGNIETPSSAISRRKANHGTPGSGEALLRGQVKTLLQKVEEEAKLSMVSLETRPFIHLQQGIVRSPMGLLAPAPANTPEMLASVSPSPVEDDFVVSQMVIDIFEGKKQEEIETEKCMVTRSLLFDFSEKSESKEKISTEEEDDDDASSIWSIQVNASSTKGDEEDLVESLEGIVEEEQWHDDGNGYKDEEASEDYDELCDGISKMSMAKFAGKHIRFVHDSVDDSEEVECESSAADVASTNGVLHLKGLPKPKGKHIRFAEDDE